MNGNKFLVLPLTLIAIAVPLRSQQPAPIAQEMEDLLYRDESAIIPEPSEISDPDDNPTPINLNAASAEELLAPGIFTSYQVNQLLIYRDKYGPFYSIYELAALPGFHSSFIKKIKHLVSISQITVAERKPSAQHMVLVNMERSCPDADGVAEYTGPRLKSSLRFRSTPRPKLTLALSYEKDAGETFLYRKRPQFLSGFISLKGSGFFRQLVLGNYQLNQGLGLVNGAGFMHRAGDFRISRQSLSRIRAYASLAESLYEQGLACMLGTEKLQFLLWASYHKFSLKPSAITGNPGTDQWLELQYTSGLFRTTREQEGRDLAYRIHSGIQVLYRNQGLSIGVLGGSEWAGLGQNTAILLEKIPAPALHQKLSLHGNWYRGKYQVFGEVAASEFRSLAFLLGSTCQFNDYISGSLLVHHYEPDYRGSLPSSYSAGSHMNNEQGLAFHLQIECSASLIIKLTSELFRYPSPPFQSRLPSAGSRLDLSFQNPSGQALQWRARLVSKAWQTTPLENPYFFRPLRDSRVTRIDGQLIYKHHNDFRWQSRLVLGTCSHQKNQSTGYAAVEQVSLHRNFFRITAQLVLFHVDEWANRIYLHEPGFYYSFSFPVYYGCGQKTSLLITCKPVKKLSVSTRCSVTRNRGKQSWEGGVQMRMML